MRRPELLGQLRPVGPSRERNMVVNSAVCRECCRPWGVTHGRKQGRSYQRKMEKRAV
jgi:hypothetical protein